MDPVLLAITHKADLLIEDLTPNQSPRCQCCNHLPSWGTVAGMALCMTCLPAFALDEPEIDTLATLIWLPYFDQGVLGRLVTDLHAACAATGSSIRAQNLSGKAAKASSVFSTLYAQRAAAIEIIGTANPSVLRQTSKALTGDLNTRRNRISGLRVLMLGHWFKDSPDHYSNAAKIWGKPD